MSRAAFLLAATLIAPAGAAQTPAKTAQADLVEFEPKVGAVGARITLKPAPPPGVEVRFGGRKVVLAQEGGTATILVPPGSNTGFVEFVKGDKVLARSAVPFVVSGSAVPKLIGLKEAIDVFGYVDARPEGDVRPETSARPVLKFGEDDLVTIGEAPPLRLGPAVELGDAASLGRRDMGNSLFLITARPPKKKTPPPPPATNN